MNKIIVLENTEILKHRLEKLLNQCGLMNVEALNYGKFLEWGLDYYFKEMDLLIIDLDHFEEDLENIISVIKKTHTVKKLPIIALTSKADKLLLRKWLSLGIEEIVAKPFEDVKLYEKIYRLRPRPTLNVTLEKSVENNQSFGGTNMLTWNDAFNIGIAEIDNEHRSIVENFGKLYQLMKEGHGHEYYQELILFLNEYVHNHFEHEEKLQEVIGFDEIESHKQVHLEFKMQIETIVNAHKGVAASDIDLIKLNLFIKDWLVHHILVEDTKIGRFMNEEEKNI